MPLVRFLPPEDERIRKTVLPNGQKAIMCVNCGEIYERVRNKV